jgi:hypothetical protein
MSSEENKASIGAIPNAEQSKWEILPCLQSPKPFMTRSTVR